jgi:hypothetical protein
LSSRLSVEEYEDGLLLRASLTYRLAEVALAAVPGGAVLGYLASEFLPPAAAAAFGALTAGLIGYRMHRGYRAEFRATDLVFHTGGQLLVRRAENVSLEFRDLRNRDENGRDDSGLYANTRSGESVWLLRYLDEETARQSIEALCARFPDIAIAPDPHELGGHFTTLKL